MNSYSYRRIQFFSVSAKSSRLHRPDHPPILLQEQPDRQNTKRIVTVRADPFVELSESTESNASRNPRDRGRRIVKRVVSVVVAGDFPMSQLGTPLSIDPTEQLPRRTTKHTKETIRIRLSSIRHHSFSTGSSTPRPCSPPTRRYRSMLHTHRGRSMFELRIFRRWPTSSPWRGPFGPVKRNQVNPAPSSASTFN